jgi:hypothetical protein
MALRESREVGRRFPKGPRNGSIPSAIRAVTCRAVFMRRSRLLHHVPLRLGSRLKFWRITMSVTRDTALTSSSRKIPGENQFVFPAPTTFFLKLGLRLVSAEEIVQSPVEEISNHIVEFLNAVEFEWNHFA